MKTPVTCLSVKTQFENAGDIAINRELIAFCSQHSDVMLDVSRCPPGFVRAMELPRHAPNAVLVSSVDLFFQMARARAGRRRVYYFLTPGGQVGEKKGFDALRMVINTLILIGIRAIGVRICHVGVSFERLGPLHASLLALRSRLMYRLFIRDEESRKIAKKLRIRTDGLIPDLAFGAARYRTDVSGSADIALSFRIDQSSEQRAMVEALVRELDRVLPCNVGFRFLAQVERDAAFMQQLSQTDFTSGRSSEYASTFSGVDDALNAYWNCSSVISNRLHALLFGLVGGCVPLAIVDHAVNTKIVGLLRVLGLPTYAAVSDLVDNLRDQSGQDAAQAGLALNQIVSTQLGHLNEVFANIYDGSTAGVSR